MIISQNVLDDRYFKKRECVFLSSYDDFLFIKFFPLFNNSLVAGVIMYIIAVIRNINTIKVIPNPKIHVNIE